MACALARCPGRCASRVLRAWLPRSLACSVCCALVPGLPCLLVPWPLCCVGGLCAWCPGLLACPALVGCVRPCVWACPVGCLAGPYFPALYCGLPGGLLKKALIFALYFSGIFSLDFFAPVCGALFFPGLFFRLREVEFFLRIFLRRNFRRIFPDLFFRIFSCPIFASISGFLFFLDVIFVRFPVFRDELFHVVKFQELVHGSLVDSVTLTF